ncbi:STAS/SEC14 domain-containing protein [Dokdonella sp.]|uniref:STAS/SEC14 domain-containing protein n=1 Tax=Dokdonella sp. TaxID=2291710 RepID=UPI003529AFFA
MSAEIVSFSDNILTMKISGKLSETELSAVQGRAVLLIRQHGAVRILVLGEDFQGWENKGDWGDLWFQAENDQYISRMAIVGERKWEELSLVFTAKGMRPFPIEYFAPSEEALARAWLEND